MIKSDRNRKDEVVPDYPDVTLQGHVNEAGFSRVVDPSILIVICRYAERRCTDNGDFCLVGNYARMPLDRIETRSFKTDLELPGKILSLQDVPRTPDLSNRNSE